MRVKGRGGKGRGGREQKKRVREKRVSEMSRVGFNHAYVYVCIYMEIEIVSVCVRERDGVCTN